MKAQNIVKMGKHTNYWYSYVRETIKRYPDGLSHDSPNGLQAIAAVYRAIEQTKLLPDGDRRVELIDMLYMKKTHTFAGAVYKLNISERTAWRWIRSFIYLTAKLMGF